MKMLGLIGSLLIGAAIYAGSHTLVPLIKKAGADDSTDNLIAASKHEVTENRETGTSSYGGVEVPYYSTQTRHIFTITARADQIEVQKVMFNRGNCSSWDMGMNLPRILKFGEEVTLSPACNVLEVDIDTDRGPLNFTFDN